MDEKGIPLFPGICKANKKMGEFLPRMHAKSTPLAVSGELYMAVISMLYLGRRA